MIFGRKTIESTHQFGVAYLLLYKLKLPAGKSHIDEFSKKNMKEKLVENENVKRLSAIDNIEERFGGFLEGLFNQNSAQYAYRKYFMFAQLFILLEFLVSLASISILVYERWVGLPGMLEANPFGSSAASQVILKSFIVSIIFKIIFLLVARRGCRLLNQLDGSGFWYGILLNLYLLPSFGFVIAIYGWYALFNRKFREKLVAMGNSSVNDLFAVFESSKIKGGNE